MIKAIPIEGWLRGCVYHDGRHGEVTLPTDKVLKIADYIQRTRRSTTDGLIDLGTLEEVPSVNRPQGEWKHESDCGITKCNKCGWSIEECIDWNYCPNSGARMKGGRVMKEYEDRKEFEKIFETARNNIKEQITAKGVSMKGSAKGTALSEIIAVFDEELELGIAEELRKGRGLIRAYYRKYNEVESLEAKLRENEQKLEAQQKVANMVSLLTDETMKNAIVAYEALSDRRGRSDAKEIVIAYIKSKGREDLMDVVTQTERSE